MKIDAHIHLFSRDIADHRERYLCDSAFGLLYGSEKARIASVQNAVKYAEDNRLDSLWTMGFCWSSGEMCDRENERIALETDGNQLFTLFSPVSSSPDSDVKKRIRKAKRDGFRGIGELAFYGHGLDETVEKYCRTVFEAACEEEMPVCLHLTEPVGHVYPGKHRTDFAVVYSLIRDFPTLRILLSHMGGGMLFYELMPEVREAFSRVWYDTAAVPFLYDAEVYEKSVSIVGSGKIIFGSDYPLLSIQRYQSDIESRLGPEDIRAVMGENAHRLISGIEV